MDLNQPTDDEEKLVEALVGHNIPTQQELSEIEPSSRLFERDGALYMTLSALRGVTEGAPTSTPIGFVLAENRLVTVRYASPTPIVAFAKHVRREPEIARNAMSVLVRLLDAIIDRLADELESSGSEIERISGHIFNKEPDDRRIPAARLTALLTRIGRAQSLLAKIRETAVSTARLLSFLGANFPSAPKGAAGRAHVASLMNDITSLIDHSGFLADNLTFLLDAALGLISVEQNAAMKLFSWSALIFLPPTLIAGIYGMNFQHMPELNWLYGYPMAISLIVASAVLPMWFLKRRGWI
jgi:magnesium transporter